MAEAEKRIIEDSQLFDEFLHATNQSAFEAMKLAENEINRHKEKTKQIKAIKAHICEVRSDICRHEDYYSFKDEIKQFIFLVHLNQSKSDNKPIVMSSAEWKSTWKDIVSIYWLLSKIIYLVASRPSNFRRILWACNEILRTF